MSEKKLLEEGTIRRFMQLANIKPLNEGKNAGGHEAEEAGERLPNLRQEAKHAEEKKKVEEKKAAPKHAEKMEEKKAHGEEEELEEGLEEELEEAYQEEGMPTGRFEEAEEPEMDLGAVEAPEAGMEGGEMSAAEELATGLIELVNAFLEKSGSTKKIEAEPEAEEEAGEGEEGEEGLEEVQVEEGMEEALAEELTRRVAARLVAEMKAKKNGKKMEEGKKGAGNWLAKPKHAKAPKGHGAGVSKGTPFKTSAPKSKSAGHKRNNLGGAGNLKAGKK
jgi:hypothetical protein